MFSANLAVDRVFEVDHRKHRYLSPCESPFDVVEVGLLLLRLDEEKG